MHEKIKTLGIPLLITLAGFLVAYQFVDPAPPSGFSLSTGQSDGSYFAFGSQYKNILKSDGVEINVMPSAGSIENLQRLKEGSVDAAFIQGGIASDVDGNGLRFLGSLYFEPLWLFHRSDFSLTRLSDLRGKRFAIGPEGSGTRAIAMQLLQDNSIDSSSARLLPLSGQDAADALADGSVDAIFLVTSAKSSLVTQLLHSHGVHLMNFERAEGYARNHPFLSPVSLPEGAIDMAANIPERTTWLLAPSATLVVREELHPALQTLLLQAASRTHSGHGLFEKAGQFPSSLYGDLPISESAKRYYKSGPSLLQRYLPFWAATLIDRLKVMMLPLIALLLPLIKVMPPIYRWRVRSRIYNHYSDLTEIDHKLHQASSSDEIQACIEQLNNIEHEVRKTHVPLAYSEELYELRTHLALVQALAEKAILLDRS
ncbi:MAG: TAXI family TRAP transporter solute-binding subunit [Mariprofundaceae bacterium]